MMVAKKSNLPDKSTALLIRELARLHVDIAAFSKVHLADQGSLKEQAVVTHSFGQGG